MESNVLRLRCCIKVCFSSLVLTYTLPAVHMSWCYHAIASYALVFAWVQCHQCNAMLLRSCICDLFCLACVLQGMTCQCASATIVLACCLLASSRLADLLGNCKQKQHCPKRRSTQPHPVWLHKCCKATDLSELTQITMSAKAGQCVSLPHALYRLGSAMQREYVQSVGQADALPSFCRHCFVC